MDDMPVSKVVKVAIVQNSEAHIINSQPKPHKYEETTRHDSLWSVSKNTIFVYKDKSRRMNGHASDCAQLSASKMAVLRVSLQV